MKEEKRKAPKRRFPGFTDDWEQCKLEDMFEIIDTKHATAPISNVKTRYRMIRTNCVRDGRLLVENTDSVTEETYEEWSERIHLRDGDLVFTREAPMGESAIIPADVNKYFPGQRIVSMRSRGKVSACFINQLFYADEFRKEIRVREAASTTVANFGILQIKNHSVSVPRLEEQVRIGECFTYLDNLITFHQRKLEQIKEYKKGMLQKMFPKKGETVPEVRFPGFEGDWEEKKLGTICERVTRKNKNNESDLPLTIASQYGLIDQRNFFNKTVAAKDMSNYYLLKRGEFAYNKSYSNGYDYGSIKRLNAYEQGCLSTLYICFELVSTDMESDYLECFFNTLQWYGDIAQICAEGARNHGLLNVDTKAFFEEVSILMPSTIAEQMKISGFINNIDSLITLYQSKLEQMKEYKKGLLQQMFV